MRPEAAFAAALLDPAVDVPAGVVGPDGAAAPRRFGVYRNNVVHGLIQGLRDTFPASEALIGADGFTLLARRHALHRPPSSPVLMEWGGDFPAEIEAEAELAPWPFLADVARLEWAEVEATHAAEATPIGPEALAGIAPEDLGRVRLELHPSLRVVVSAHAVVSILADTRGLLGEDAAVDPRRAEAALVVRPDAEVEIAAVTPTEARLVVALGAASLAAATEIVPDADLGAVLTRLFSLGAVAGFTLDS